MDDFKIFIDTDSEITFILERILKSKQTRIVLIVPDRSSFLSSKTNLKIVKKITDKSNKLLIIVTLDNFGAKLARQTNFVVLSRVGEIQESHWELIQKQKFESIKSKSQSEKSKSSKIELNLETNNPEPLIKYLKVENSPVHEIIPDLTITDDDPKNISHESLQAHLMHEISNFEKLCDSKDEPTEQIDNDENKNQFEEIKITSVPASTKSPKNDLELKNNNSHIKSPSRQTLKSTNEPTIRPLQSVNTRTRISKHSKQARPLSFVDSSIVNDKKKR